VFPQLFGKYVLEREIAAGGMARVYLATLRGAVGFEKRLVVKQIRPELASDQAFVQRFVSEAKTAVGLSHPNIVAVYELGVEQGVYYIAMELCPGVTLSEILGATGKLSAQEGAYVGVEICRALDYAHRKAGIVHRDVTPRNVLIDEEGAVRLIDFGIAAVVSGDNQHEVFGSPGHMPPEQLAGSALTPATDVFAVATLLVEAWTLRPPFRRENSRESRRALAEPVPPLASEGEELAPLSALIARGLSLDAKQRPPEAELLARPLRDYLRSADLGDVARRLGARVRRAAQRSRTDDRPSATPPASGGDSAPRSSRSSAGSLTRTFAARQEVSEWTRRISEPPPPSTPSTRKLSSRAPASATTLPHSEPAPAEAAEGLPRAPRDSPAPRSGPVRRARAAALFAAGALIASAVLGALQLLGARSPNPDGIASAPAPVPRAPSPSAGTRANGASAPPAVRAAGSASAPVVPLTARMSEGPALPSSNARRSRAPAPVAERKPASSSQPSPALNATASLQLTSDPPAAVGLRGPGQNRRLSTPVRELRLPAGAYTVTFESATYGVPVSTRVVIEEGTRRSVHADFREAEPKITVR
jgi:eukaryotic-like serine/threonine-protein kinase